MGQRKFTKLLAVVLAVFPWAIAVSVRADGLTYPGVGKTLGRFPSCSRGGQEFCIESLMFTKQGGSESEINDPGSNHPKSPYVVAYLQGQYNGTTTPGNAFGLMPTLAISVETADMFTGIRPKTVTGIDDGTYRMRIRLGDYDPTYMVIRADVSEYNVIRGADGYFTIEMEVSPIPWLYVGEAELASCRSNNWLTNCEATVGMQNWIQAGIAMSTVDVTRNVSRGYWIGTSASEFLLTQPRQVESGGGVREYQQTFTVAAPHYVPEYFEVPGLVEENGRKLYPAFFETYIPFKSIQNSLSKITSMKDVSVEQIKNYLGTEGRLLQGVIYDEDKRPQVQDLTITLLEDGVRINFNLEHFSAPNPALVTVSPLRDRKVLANGSVVSTLRRVSKGSTITNANLFAPSNGSAVSKVVSRTPLTCQVAGISVQMVKTGSCKMSLTVARGLSKATIPINVVVY